MQHLAFITADSSGFKNWQFSNTSTFLVHNRRSDLRSPQNAQTLLLTQEQTRTPQDPQPTRVNRTTDAPSFGSSPMNPNGGAQEMQVQERGTNKEKP